MLRASDRMIRCVIIVLALACWSTIASAQIATVTRNVNLRSDPSTGQPPLQLLTLNAPLILLSTTPDHGYYRVRTADGHEGYVWAPNVRVSATAAPPTTPAPPPPPAAGGGRGSATFVGPPAAAVRELTKDAGHKSLKTKAAAEKKSLTPKARLAFIRKAQIWAPTNVPEMDLRAGPQGQSAFQPNEMVTCDYVETKLPGTTPKFDCTLPDGEVVKVRYGQDNGKVEGAVLTSRVLWALGFGADRLYPVRVTCRGCSADPWEKRGSVSGEQVFDPAAIERKPKGHEMKSEYRGGWAWPELELVDEQQGGAAKAQRDALKLLAVLLQHTDNKAENERLLCLPGGATGAGGCEKPFMMLHDVGLTFGHANFANRDSTGSVNFDEWSTTPIWRDAKACVGHMSESYTGTLGDPKISEAGRQFLADLLVQLTDQQLRDLFTVGRVDRRSRKPGSTESPATVDEWVLAFKHKRDEIVANRCAS